MIDRSKALEKEAESLRLNALQQKAQAFTKQVQDVNGIKLVVGRLDGADASMLQDICSNLIATLGSGHICLLGSADMSAEKVFLACAVAEDLVKGSGIQAGRLVGIVAKVVGGGGGGRPTLATAGGKLPGKLDEALAGVDSTVKSLMS